MIGGMEAAEFNKQIRDIVYAWCDRRDIVALSDGLLTAWLTNNGLTDGWVDLASALRTSANSPHLPVSEREILKRLSIEVDVMLRNR
jgi:hypothetical protein